MKVDETGINQTRAKKMEMPATTSAYMKRPIVQESAADSCRNSPLTPATMAAKASSAARSTRLTMRSKAMLMLKKLKSACNRLVCFLCSYKRSYVIEEIEEQKQSCLVAASGT